MDDFKPGDVEIEECILHSHDGRHQFNLRGQARAIDIYESVYESIIYGEIIIADAIGLLKGFPIIGEEYITLKFKTPSFNSLEFKLNVYEIADVDQANNNKYSMYTLRLCSPEMFTNSIKLINKRYKAQISSTIKTLVSKELESKKTVEIETTRGIDDHLVSKMTPFETIDKLRHRALSTKNESSSYLFYENSKGYHFVTLEELIQRGKGNKKIDKVYFSDDNIDTDQAQIRFRDIIAFNQPVAQNSLQQLRAGALSNTVKKFDLLTGKVINIKYKDAKSSSIFKNTADIPNENSSKFKNKYGKTTSRSRFVPFTSAIDDNLISEKVSKLHPFVEKVAKNLMEFYIYGDTSLALGEVINCNFSDTNGLKGDETPKLTSNNFLVTKIRHMINVLDRPFYGQSIEGINNSYDF